MIDMSKIKVGDEVTVHGTVIGEPRLGTIEVRFPINGSGSFSEQFIATHTPKPHEFKPGDRVTWGTGVIAYEFFAVRNGLAVLWNDVYGWQPKDVSDLRHADESE